jgi:septal ring factor EnvC (AmiA/AmiB activator)
MLKVLFKTCVFILFLFVFGTSFATKRIEAAKGDLSDIKQKIETLKRELDSNQEAHNDAADALKESETAISASNRTIREIAHKQKENLQTLTQLKQQSLSINERLADQQKQLSGMLYAQYAQGDQSYTQLLLQNKNPSQISRDLKYQSYIEKAHAKLIDDMQANLKQVKKLHVETTEKLQEVADLKAKREAEKRELEQQKQEKAKVLISLSSKISTQRKEIDKLKRDEASLTNLVEKLAKIAAARPHRKKIPKANNKTGKPKQDNQDEKIGEPLAKNEDTPDDNYSNVRFVSLKGKLKLPVRGEISNRFGSTREDSGVSWKGLFIKAAEGTEVKSVASGRVVFSDWMRGFGNLIIVDHGGGFMSLYGNNQAVLKHEGDEVNAGDTIASVGNSGGNESNGLYYELRNQSKPFDPLSWSVVK